ncbi:hypothetical protein GY45DRAFT_1326301 [Cubamyces sp. BRFM 1775]|nr:hypothetical protein GY45DRAFT_1326301 [Cubamyces sp. BRFM 1775]
MLSKSLITCSIDAYRRLLRPCGFLDFLPKCPFFTCAPRPLCGPLWGQRPSTPLSTFSDAKCKVNDACLIYSTFIAFSMNSVCLQPVASQIVRALEAAFGVPSW